MFLIVLFNCFESELLHLETKLCWMQERCGLFRVGAGASLLGGVVLIAKPPIIFGSSDDGEEDTYDLIGNFLALMIILSIKILVNTRQLLH